MTNEEIRAAQLAAGYTMSPETVDRLVAEKAIGREWGETIKAYMATITTKENHV